MAIAANPRTPAARTGACVIIASPDEVVEVAAGVIVLTIWPTGLVATVYADPLMVVVLVPMRAAPALEVMMVASEPPMLVTCAP